MKAATCKLESGNQDFDKDQLEATFEKLGIKVKYVDLDTKQYEYWQNDYATVVFTLEQGTPEDFADAMNMAGPDEFDTKKVGTKRVIRIWWD